MAPAKESRPSSSPLSSSGRTPMPASAAAQKSARFAASRAAEGAGGRRGAAPAGGEGAVPFGGVAVVGAGQLVGIASSFGATSTAGRLEPVDGDARGSADQPVAGGHRRAVVEQGRVANDDRVA